jgi:hypothetical protein
MQKVEARTGRELVGLLREMRYERHLTRQEMATELTTLTGLDVRFGTVCWWLFKLGLNRTQLRRAAEDRNGS